MHKKLISARNTVAFAAAGGVVVLAACGGSGSGAGTGVLGLQITDAPVDSAEHVYVQISGLEIHGAGGNHFSLRYCQDAQDATKTVISTQPCATPPAPKRLDLLALNGGLAATLLDAYVLPAGEYQWIRLVVDTAGVRDSFVVALGGAEYELTIPSGDETGLKLNRGFTVPAGGAASFTVDFDLRKSVHVTGEGEYLLRPTLRLADNVIVGAIAGTVSTALVPTGCTPAVYVFAGASVTPDDIDGTPADPVSTALVKLNNGDGTYRYRAAYLEAGTYTVAYTCQAALDNPATNDAIGFSGAATVTVGANATTVHNF